MANEYASSPELKKSLSLTGETFADDDIALALTAASRGIDKITNRRFYPDGDANQVRYYSPARKHTLLIDDLITLTNLQSDPDGSGDFADDWTLNTDFVLEPLNASAQAAPWNRIRAHPSGSYLFPTTYPRSVRITGKFGWAAAPSQIKEATMILASKLLRRVREAPFGVVMSIEGGEAMRIARMDPDVRFLIDPYRHVSVG